MRGKIKLEGGCVPRRKPRYLNLMEPILEILEMRKKQITILLGGCKVAHYISHCNRLFEIRLQISTFTFFDYDIPYLRDHTSFSVLLFERGFSPHRSWKNWFK